MTAHHLRFRYSKLGKVRWTSHRDLARMWERAFRRIQLPLQYSQGFSPRPKVSFGLALPTGAESEAEYLDAEVATGAEFDLVALSRQLSLVLPTGVDVGVVGLVPADSRSLQHDVTSSVWSVVLDEAADGVDAVSARIAATLAAETVVISRERKGTRADEDIRPGIISCTATEHVVLCELVAQPRTLRPAELLVALGLEPTAGRARRISQWIERDGAREEPLALPAAATAAPHATECAS